MSLECEHGQLARACNICEYEREIAELRARVVELEAERDADRRREYGYSQETVDALTSERDKLTKRVMELEAELSELKQEIQGWKNSRDGVLSQIEDMALQLTEAREEIERLRKALEAQLEGKCKRRGETSYESK